MMSQDTGGKIFVGVLMLLVGLGFALAALADFYLLVKVSSLGNKGWLENAYNNTGCQSNQRCNLILQYPAAGIVTENPI
jgi:hypothetical protein